ncbi:hypothetical protein HNR06_004464 [Nocardiopsis arvandica]|uniref:Secreted protein n=1 Tax=Nocardiopsis sinuspersici TaxID=501010 RepID=A0A7Y9XI49_9ACTN|nr:hypothetical protein [Nocardiopsis sinuspersici]NYH54875.1 hypothetical protein [Nocardiopsis sinuspersici]
METGTMTVTVLVALAVVALAGGIAIAARFLLLPAWRTARLRKHFGTEYDHAVQDHDDTSAAERDLSARLRRRQDTELRALAVQEREAYADTWATVQQVFVDAPDRAVRDARALVSAVMADLGYPDPPPDEGFERRLRDLSVDHPAAVADVRGAQGAEHSTGPDRPHTEHLREVLVAHRGLVDALLGGGLRPAARGGPRPSSKGGPRPAPKQEDKGKDEQQQKGKEREREPEGER